MQRPIASVVLTVLTSLMVALTPSSGKAQTPGAAGSRAQSPGFAVVLQAGVAFHNYGSQRLTLADPGWLGGGRVEVPVSGSWVALMEGGVARFNALGHLGTRTDYYVYGRTEYRGLAGAARHLRVAAVDLSAGAAAGVIGMRERVERTVGSPAMDPPPGSVTPHITLSLLLDARVPLQPRLALVAGVRDDILGLEFNEPALSLGLAVR